MTNVQRIRDAVLVAVVTLLCAISLKTFVVEAYRIPSGSMENTLLVGDLVLVDKLAYGLRTPGVLPLTERRIPSLPLLSFGHVRRGDVIVFEFTHRSPDGLPADLLYYVKRCIGIPGDTIAIRRGRVFVNGLEMLPPSTVIAPRFRRIMHREAMFPEGAGFTDIDYGPLRVPKKGDSLSLSPQTLPALRTLIAREGHAVDIATDGSVLIDGAPRNAYVVESDYYFVLGDHRDNSADSRMWGYVGREDIVGEAFLVYWSTVDDDGTHVRWDRVGSFVR